MFSPDAPSHTHSLRPKRSRQAASDDSIKFPQAKRKRSALRRDTFEPLTDASINQIAGRSNGDGEVNGHITRKETEKPVTITESKPLTLRGGKKADKRLDRAGGALTLSSNDFYSVTQLPALPDQIRSRPAVPYSSIFSVEYGYALALTHTDALLWNYNTASSTPATRDTLSFKLPFQPALASDPLPLAAFTTRTAAGEPGIVAVSPRSGKIVYWETITNASSFVPGQTSNGVQASIPSLLSGETVKEIISAEPAGFILVFSHGRVAHLTVRDQMGRPGIGLQFLRKSNTDGSLLGSIKNVFGGDRRKGTPIVRAGRSSKAQRDVTVGTEDGELEFWDTNLGVGNSIRQTLSIKEDLLEALKHNLPDEASAGLHFKILDFELVAGPSSSQFLSKQGDQEAIPLTVLATITNDNESTYFIIELTVTGKSAIVQVVHRVKCYKARIGESRAWRPRLCLSKLSQVAFIIFDTAVVLFSLARIEESPSSQLLFERNALPDPFQDCIRFQETAIYQVLGCTVEEEDSTNKNPACIIAVQGFGIVRFTSTVPHTLSEDNDELEMRVSPKNKIEQAIFFGTIRQNPLDLTGKTSGQTFTDEEICSAALEISSEILGSRSKYLPKSTPSIDSQMKLRAKALEDLIHHTVKFYAASLSRATRFHLLLNAEKLSAAQALWRAQEGIQRRYHDFKDREHGTYLQFTLKALHESKQTYPEPLRGETDRVRHWLTYDPEHINNLVNELVDCFGELEPMDVIDPRVVLDYHCEATDLWNAAFDAAYNFRENNAPLYGLADEIFIDGVLQTVYPEGLPEVWTCTLKSRAYGLRLLETNCELLKGWCDSKPSKTKKNTPVNEKGQSYDAPSKQSTSELVRRLPTQAELWTRIVREDMIQLIQQTTIKEPDRSNQMRIIADAKEQERAFLRTGISKISDFNMPGAIALAEKLADPGLLHTLTTEYIRQLLAEGAANPDQTQAIQAKLLSVQDHAETYFERFGRGWAFAHFSHMVAVGDLGIMLTEVEEAHDIKQPFLTWFFKKCEKFGQHVGKISWINEVIGEQNFYRAQKTLENVAMEQETDLWSKRTELSLAKLVGLAAQESTKASQNETKRKDANLCRYDHALQLLDIQKQLCIHITSTIGPTIDAKAAQDLAMESFGKRVIEKQPAMKKLLKRALDRLLDKQALSPQELVDALTLSDPVQFNGLPEEDPQVLGHEFSLALTVVDMADASQVGKDEKDCLRRQVWRRAMIRDDWLALNETSLKDDQQVESEMVQSSLFRALAQILGDAHTTNSKVPVLYSPQDILGMDAFPRPLHGRFEEGQLVKIDKDLQAEQQRLKTIVEKGRLEIHYGGLVSTAERQVRAKADTRGDEVAAELLNGTEDCIAYGNGKVGIDSLL